MESLSLGMKIHSRRKELDWWEKNRRARPDGGKPVF
jgi:hypothetical protein